MSVETSTRAAGARASDDVPRLADGVELIGELKRSGYRRPPRLVRRADGQTVTLTPLLYLTARALSRHDDPDEVAAEVSEAYGRRLTVDDVRLLATAKLRPLGLVKDADGTDPVVRRSNPLLALTLRVVLSNPRITNRLSSMFGWTFRPVVAVPVVVAFVAASVWVLVERGLTSAAEQAFYQPETLLLIWAATVASAGFHELGHAAACRYGGARPGVMGAGLYLVWPAFYTDVSDSYRLGRGGRLRVDVGGLYFNAVFALGTVAAWWLTGLEALLLVLLAQHLQMLRQLAPFIRADGYHVVADLTGVPDLFGHIKPTLLSMVPRRWGGRPHTVLKTWARVVVTAWVLLVTPLLIGLLVAAVHVLPALAATAWDSIGLQRAAVVRSWHDGDLAAATVAGVYILVVATPVLAIVLLLGRLATRIVPRVWRGTRGRPRARALAAITGLAVLAAVAWSWWPHGQYEPLDGEHHVSVASGVVLTPARLTHATALGDAARPPSPPLPGQVRAALASAPTTEFYLVREPDAPADSWPSYGVVAQPGEQPWVFPFPPPPAPEPGDNQAVAVNTSDDTLATAMAVAWAVVGDDMVLERNEAHAYASCDRCAAIAAAFQVLLLVDDPVVVAPVNAAVAASYDCNRCATAAIAVQLVVSLTHVPSDEAMSRIEEALDAVAAMESQLGSMTVQQVYQALTAASEEVLAILVEDGVAPTWLQEAALSDGGTPTEGGPTLDPPSTPTSDGPTVDTSVAPPSGSPTPATPAPGTATDGATDDSTGTTGATDDTTTEPSPSAPTESPSEPSDPAPSPTP